MRDQSDAPPGHHAGGALPLTRAVAVVSLLALAALALRGRSDLAWDELSDPADVRWARLLGGSLAMAALLGAARAALRRLRRHRRPPRAPGGDPEPERFPLLLRLLAVVLVVAALALAWWLVLQAVPSAPPDTEPGPPAATGPGVTAAPARLPWPTLLVVAGVLAATALLDRTVAARARRGAPAGATGDQATGDEGSQALADAVAAAEVALARDADARTAIVAAYRAMAASLATGLDRRGRPARGSDTPTELLDRAVVAGIVGPGPAGELTALFREARFSSHPMGPEQRSAAEGALARVGAELGARRNASGHGAVGG